MGAPAIRQSSPASRRPALRVADERDRDYERAVRESYPTVAAAERERYGTVDDLAREAYGRQWGTSSRAKRARERGA